LWILTVVYGFLAAASTVIVSRNEARHEQ
jgi:hypothetical protein